MIAETNDRQRLRRSALHIGLWTGVASAVILTLGAGILFSVVLVTSRPEGGRGRDGPAGPAGMDHLVVDVDRLLPWIVLLCAAGVILLGLVAWAAARRAVRPLGEALAAQRSFVADASHELRTPLTALTSRIQIVQRRLDRGEDPRSSLDALRQDARTMDNILAELLVAAEGQALHGTSDAAAVAAESVERFRDTAGARDITLVCHTAARPTVPVADVTLGRIFAALIDNALEHSPAHSTVTVSVTQTHGTAELRVSDQGSGVAAQDRERIFERFARGPEQGRARSFGIGLSLVREIVTQARGTVTLEDSTPQGSTFLVRLPLSIS